MSPTAEEPVPAERLVAPKVHPPMVPAVDVIVPVNDPLVATMFPLIDALDAVRLPAVLTEKLDPIVIELPLMEPPVIYPPLTEPPVMYPPEIDPPVIAVPLIDAPEIEELVMVPEMFAPDAVSTPVLVTLKLAAEAVVLPA